MVNHLVVVGRVEGLVAGQAHQRVAVGRGEVGPFQQLLPGETMELPGHLRAAAEHAANAHLLQRHFLAKGLQELGRGEHAADVVVGPQDRQGLLDHVVLVLLDDRRLALLDQPDHPPRIEVHAESDAAPHLGQVLDGQPQPSRAGRAEHQPVGPAGEALVAERLAEHRVIDAKIVDVDAALGDARAPAGLEDVDRPVGESPWAPSGGPARRGATRPGSRRAASDRRTRRSRGGGPNRAARRSPARRACRSAGRSARRRPRGPRHPAAPGLGDAGRKVDARRGAGWFDGEAHQFTFLGSQAAPSWMA